MGQKVDVAAYRQALEKLGIREEEDKTCLENGVSGKDLLHSLRNPE